MPAVSPNKTIEGSLGNLLPQRGNSTEIYMIVDVLWRGYYGFSLLMIFFYHIPFSIAGQFGDLAESD